MSLEPEKEPARVFAFDAALLPAGTRRWLTLSYALLAHSASAALMVRYLASPTVAVLKQRAQMEKSRASNALTLQEDEKCW
jgi:hypothetical protein